MTEFRKFVEEFVKRPIFVEQEALIVAAMHEGKINKATALMLCDKVMTHNINKLKELDSLSVEELIERYCDDL